MSSSAPQGPSTLEDEPAKSVVTVRSVLRMLSLIGAVGIAAVVVSRFLPPRDEIVGIVEAAGAWGPVLATGGVALLLLALTARTPLSWVAGALFGWVPAMIYILVGTMLAAMAGFALGRFFGREWVNQILSHRDPGPIRARIASTLSKADAWLGEHGVVGVGLVRLVPAAPYGVVSYLFGTTGTRFGQYTLGCLLGGLPATVGNTAIGAAIWGPAAVPVAVGVLLGLATLTLSIRWWLQRRGLQTLEEDAPKEA